MGGDSSKNSHAEVHVSVEHRQYNAGESVKGYVEVNVRSSMSCSEVYGRLFGEVRTAVKYTSGSGKNRHRHTAHGFESIIEQRVLLAQFPGGQAQPGRYQFPFLYALHPGLPSSAIVTGSDHASLVYGVEVQLVRPGFMKWDLLHKAAFNVMARVPHRIQPAMLSNRQEVNCCCCFGKGDLLLSAALESNAFCADEEVRVQFQVQNNSTQDVDNVVVSVREDIAFTARGHSGHKSYVIVSRMLEGVKAGAGFGPNLGSPPQTVALKLPPHFENCTVKTNILSISHFVEVRGDTACCVDNPCVSLPVTFYSPIGQAIPMASAPPEVEDGDMFPVPSAPYLPDPHAWGSPVALEYVPLGPVAPALAVEPSPQGKQPRTTHVWAGQAVPVQLEMVQGQARQPFIYAG